MCYLCDQPVRSLRGDVENGAAVLDGLPELEGVDWRKMVRDNADRLNMWSCVSCVLGIIFDDKSTDTYAETYDEWDYDSDDWVTETRFEEYDSGYNWFVMSYPEFDTIELGFCPGAYDSSDLRDMWLEYVNTPAAS